MFASIITPSHNPRWLPDLYRSLVAQTIEDWEWIVVLNGEILNHRQDFPFCSDPRVHMVLAPQGLSGIGALKQMACSLGTGDVLVEADHDDELTPTCLARLQEVFADETVGFAYSNTAMLGPHERYNPHYGWEYTTLNYKGQALPVPLSFPPEAATMLFIWTAPNHVRAWRRTVYEELGGHDASLRVCDDHDLLARTYLQSKMVHIPEALYIQRITGENTSFRESNALIQKTTVDLQRKYIYPLVERWCDIEGLSKIDLCGGFGKPAGYQSLDIIDGVDLEQGIPLPDNSVGVIRAHDALEHIRDQRKLMAEIHRVLVDGGWLLSLTPSTDGRGAFQDPTHVSYWNQNSFYYWTRPQQAKYIRNETVRFQEFRLETIYPSEQHKADNILYVLAHLRAVKSDARRPYLNPWK